MIRFPIVLAPALSLVAGCAAHRPPPGPLPIAGPAAAAPAWRALATPADRARIDGLSATWRTVRAGVTGRAAKRMAAEGALLDPDRALDGPAPPTGSYRCRLLRLGGSVGYRTFAPDFCYVAGSGSNLSFTKQTGTNLPGGWLAPDGERRLVFLGTFRPQGSSVVAPYGSGAARDVAGVLERVAPVRWRLVLTPAGGGAALDVYELVPAVPAAPPARSLRRPAR